MKVKIDEKYKWDFSDYFSSEKEWETCLKDYKKKIEEMSQFVGKLNDMSTILLCFKRMEELSVMSESLATYAFCLRDLDVTNAHQAGLVNKIESALTYHAEQTSFIEPEISSLDNEFLQKLASDYAFSPYKRLLSEIIREKEHILPEAQERLLSGISSFSEDFANNHSNFENGDLKFNRVKSKSGVLRKMDLQTAAIFLKGSDRPLRENTFKELQGAYGRFNTFLSSNYLAEVKKNVFFTKVRHFNSSLEKAFFYENVPSIIYKKLISNVEDHLALDYEFFELKRQIMGLDKMLISDVYYNPFKIKREYTFEQAMDKVCKALEILGDDYVKYIRFMQNTRKIDAFPSAGKRSGAYETMAPTKSPRVLTNFMGKYTDISTLAHELGHAMHSYYSDKAQSPTDSQYTIFLAEIASTVNEILLNQFDIAHIKNRRERLYLICEFLFEFHSTVFRQTMFSRFEGLIHEKVEKDEEVNSEVLNSSYLELVKKYFGEGVEVFDEAKYEWSRIPHFYTPFYVYKYATGMICAINIVQGLKKGTISVEDYKAFLSAGCSIAPCDALKLVKIDLTKDKPYRIAFDYIRSLLKTFKESLPKYKCVMF